MIDNVWWCGVVCVVLPIVSPLKPSHDSMLGNKQSNAASPEQTNKTYGGK